VADEDDVAIAAISAAELLAGVELARGRRKTARRAFVERLLTAISVEPYDLEVARSHALLLASVRTIDRPRGAHDPVIAATARARARIVVTADESGFAGLPDVGVRALPSTQ
jgi:tRNA(fMet)-specific endonuclease VapC